MSTIRRWEEQTSNDQLNTQPRGPGRVLRSRLPDLVHQQIRAWLIVHHTIAALITQAAPAADPDPDRVSFTNTPRLLRRTATGTADIPPQDREQARPALLSNIASLLHPHAVNGPAPRAVKRARHNNYRVNKPTEPASTRHHRPATIRLHTLNPRAA